MQGGRAGGWHALMVGVVRRLFSSRDGMVAKFAKLDQVRGDKEEESW